MLRPLDPPRLLFPHPPLEADTVITSSIRLWYVPSLRYSRRHHFVSPLSEREAAMHKVQGQSPAAPAG